MTDRDYAIALANFIGFGPKSFEFFRTAFPSYEAAWHAEAHKLLALDIREKTVRAFLTFRERHDPASFAELCTEHGIITVLFGEEAYPPLLREIHDPPGILFLKITNTTPVAKVIAAPTVAFVGSRHCTEYGRKAAKLLAGDVARAGVTVVSGLAYGIDAAAHQAALDAGGSTLAVLPSGLLGMDNARQVMLADAIFAGNGILLSEFPLTAPPFKHHFPIRNRIISGLCKATVIVEAGVPSGTLITARCAIEQNREVIAVPGPITSRVSAGTNRLLREGAHVATSAQDILDVLGLASPRATMHSPSPKTHDPATQRLLALLSDEPKLLDDIAKELGQSVSETAVMVSLLELDGVIRDAGGKRFVFA